MRNLIGRGTVDGVSVLFLQRATGIHKSKRNLIHRAPIQLLPQLAALQVILLTSRWSNVTSWRDNAVNTGYVWENPRSQRNKVLYADNFSLNQVCSHVLKPSETFISWDRILKKRMLLRSPKVHLLFRVLFPALCASFTFRETSSERRYAEKVARKTKHLETSGDEMKCEKMYSNLPFTFYDVQMYFCHSALLIRLVHLQTQNTYSNVHTASTHT